jgi:hypothetical protein
MRDIELALVPIYKVIFELYMDASRPARAGSGPPPLDPDTAFGMADDAARLTQATGVIAGVLADPERIRQQRLDFPHNDLGGALFDLAAVLYNLADLAFPTLGRIESPQDVEWLRLRLDDREVELLRRRARRE